MSAQSYPSLFKPYHALIYLLGLLAIYSAYLFAMPIRMGDTDMWYHLNGGRYFWEFLRVPDTAFFSYLNPDKEWTNYFWGFQAIIYKIYETSGYMGLLITRALLSTLTVTLFLLILKKKLSINNSLILLVIFAAFLLIYEGRAHQLRPHLFSYLLILLFFYILQYKQTYAPALPVITVFWANIHGVEWPVPALICGSYALPVIIKLIRKQTVDIEKPHIYLVSIFLCPLAFLINPYGIELYFAPFNVDSDTYLYIGELAKLNYQTLTTIQVSSLQTSLHSALSLLFILFTIYFLVGIKNRNIPLPAIILYLGGCLLLYKGVRFIWEWLLLMIPLIIYILEQQDSKSVISEINTLSRHIFIILLLAIVGSTLYEKSKLFGQYPFDSRNLPQGTADFLLNTKSTGKILSPPTLSGYIEWKLYPNFHTFIDMQFPPSTDMDMYQVARAFKNEFDLETFVDKYQPDWILLPVNHQPSSVNIKHHDQYIPVYAGDVMVAYANKATRSTIIDKFEIKHVNPHNLFEKNEEKKALYIEELEQLWELDAQSKRFAQSLASFYRDDKNLEKAHKYAEAFVDLAPYDPNSHYLLGITLRDLEQYERAIPVLEKALKITNHNQKYIIQLALAATYYFNNNFTEAYQLFKKSVNPYLNNVEPDVMYMYALSATIYGDFTKAEKLLEMIIYSTNPETHSDIVIQSKDLKQKIINGDFDAPSFIEWAFNKLTGK